MSINERRLIVLSTKPVAISMETRRVIHVMMRVQVEASKEHATLMHTRSTPDQRH